MSIVGSIPELDCEPFFCNCISSGVVNNGDRHLSERDDGGECLILEADDCACCVPNNGDVEPSEPEGGGEYTTLNTDDCACGVLKNGGGDLCKIRGENCLTGKAVQNIAAATGHFMQQMLVNVKRNVGDILQNADIGNDEDLENIARVFDDTAQKVELLRTPLRETFSNRSNYCGSDKIVSNITFLGTAIIVTTSRL